MKIIEHKYKEIVENLELTTFTPVFSNNLAEHLEVVIYRGEKNLLNMQMNKFLLKDIYKHKQLTANEDK